MFTAFSDCFGKLQKSLSMKLVILVMFLTTLSMTGVFFAYADKEKNDNLRRAAMRAEDLTKVIQIGLRSTMNQIPHKATAEFLTQIADLECIHSVSIHDASGLLLFSGNDSSPTLLDFKDILTLFISRNQISQPGQESLQHQDSLIPNGNSGRFLRRVSLIPNEQGCSTPLCHTAQNDAPFLGSLELTIPVESNKKVFTIRKTLPLLVALISLTGMLLTLLMTTKYMIHRPMQRILRGIRRIAHGDYTTVVTVNQHDQFGLLAETINRMARNVETHHAELSRQRALYQSLFEGVPCLITVQDRNYTLLRFNQAFADRFNAQPGDHCYEAYKGRNRKCDECPVERTFADGLSHTTEEIGSYKDGTRAHWIVNTAPIYDEKGTVVAAMEMSLDITQRKRLEEDLRASEQKYYAIFNTIPSAVLAIDAATHHIIDCNKTAISLYGYTKGNLIRKPFEKLISPDEIAAHKDAFATTLSLRRTKHIDANKKEFWASVTLSRTRFQTQDVLLTVITDISERISSEEQLIQASKMATLGEMATGVAHELNQPLAVLQMIANLFRRKLKHNKPIDAETAGNMADKITNNVNRATKIINHMREFGRKSNLETEEVRLNRVVRRAFDLFSQQLKLHNITVEWYLEEEQPIIHADSNRLEQVFINMLINARDAIEERCANAECSAPERFIVIRTRSTRRSVIAEIHDSGTGIPKELLPRLFEPFFTTKEVGQGTGLGLSISYGIVTDYGGTIHVTSPRSHGSRFTITFPRAATRSQKQLKSNTYR
ncbi:PAS domain S-box protein [Pseudodesulfovibrio piezophilus]|uniref:histidine kinase n=1 Tax=Pseudodesulfovibrio piezophilus (strain DSM 21447 / JCM 15486 / C1TLV30) TaxID=1322246 RepID=M1WSB3_PSEP2|nr:PAS domain S-box protein [Pseudodesulfovibrio piezophilus]CCH48802.1 PAS/PAC sensor signal transduction histidine kinase [Pseudodesulfovibrio piezophilus C1TLV30]